MPAALLFNFEIGSLLVPQADLELSLPQLPKEVCYKSVVPGLNQNFRFFTHTHFGFRVEDSSPGKREERSGLPSTVS